jgi:hypothetical protein
MKKTLITTMLILQSGFVFAEDYCQVIKRASCGETGSDSAATCARVEACASLSKTSEKLGPLQSRSDAITQFSAGFKAKKLDTSVSTGFTKRWGDRITPEYMMAPEDSYIDQLAEKYKSALTSAQIASLKTTAATVRADQKSAFDEIITLLGSSGSHLTGDTAQRVVLAKVKLKEAQEKTPENTEGISAARKELLEAATIAASSSSDRGTRQRLATQIGKVSKTAGTIHAAISPIAQQIQKDIEKETDLIQKNRVGIAKWYVDQKSGKFATDRANMLSKLMMLQLKDIGKDATAVLDSLKADIDKSILGKYVAEQIKMAKKECKPGSNILESLNALGRAATDLACGKGGIAKQTACQAFQGKFEAASQNSPPPQ